MGDDYPDHWRPPTDNIAPVQRERDEGGVKTSLMSWKALKKLLVVSEGHSTVSRYLDTHLPTQLPPVMVRLLCCIVFTHSVATLQLAQGVRPTQVHSFRAAANSEETPKKALVNISVAGKVALLHLCIVPLTTCLQSDIPVPQQRPGAKARQRVGAPKQPFGQ